MQLQMHHLRDLVAVAQAGSLRAAARATGQSQSALTKSIRALESELGTPLFERTARGMTLNAYGAAFLVRARRVAHELRRGQEELRQLRGERGGNVAFGVSGTPALRFLVGALERFERRYPDASVRVVEGLDRATLPALRDGTLDFAVIPQRVKPVGREFETRVIFADERFVVGRRGHALRSQRSLADLVDARWVVTGADGPRGEGFKAPFQAHGLPVPRSNLRCESLMAVLALVASSDRLVLLPRQWLDSLITRDLLERIAVRERIDGPAICLLRRAGEPLTPAADAMADALALEAADLARKAQPGARV